MTDPAQITAAVQAAEERFGAIDVLVNNAGYGYQASVEEGEDAEIRAQFEANVFGLFAMIRAVLPGMRARRRGHILNITSVAGFVGFPGSGYYAASKHAVEGLSDALGARGRAARHQGHLRRARPVPHRLGRAFAAADAEPHRRLRRDGRRAPHGDGREERQAGGRSRCAPARR